jgi:hypothetical protein
MCSEQHPHDENSEPTAEDIEEEIDSQLSQEQSEDYEVGDLAPGVDLPAPDEIASLYNMCLDFVNRAIGVPLDFTDETLPIVDHYVSSARDEIALRPELAQVLTRAIGAYFGELVRRRINGYWLIPNPDIHNWRVCARSVFLCFNPLGAAYDALAQGEDHDGPSGQLQLAPEDQSLIAERLAVAPPVPDSEYYLLSTRLEAIDIVVETLRIAMERGGHAGVEFDLEDYERMS